MSDEKRMIGSYEVEHSWWINVNKVDSKKRKN